MRPARTGEETIVARATAAGRAAVALIRLSGSRAKSIAGSCLGVRAELLEERRPRLGIVHDARGDELDRVLVTWFRAPRSYTGEDVVEISCHGSPFICRSIIESCLARGARAAEPGEFTRRAFLNGKLDLVQAEAVRDLVASQTEYQAALARRQLEGRLAKELQPVREKLIDIVAQLETRLEFVEEDVDPESRRNLAREIERVGEVLLRLSRNYGAARTIREGATVVLAGRPNAGKSSIFNSLVRDERAIVTEIPGTTRDALREWLDLGGLAVCLIDTAGIGKAGDLLVEEGMKRSRRHIGEADLVLLVVDAVAGFGREDEGLVESIRDRPFLLTINKTDLAEAPTVPEAVKERASGVVEISVKTGANLTTLAEAVRGSILGADGLEKEPPLITNLRQMGCIEEARENLTAGCSALEEGLSEEFVCYDLRRVLDSISELTGETTTEDILGRIFSTFCIGK